MRRGLPRALAEVATLSEVRGRPSQSDGVSWESRIAVLGARGNSVVFGRTSVLLKLTVSGG